jgi:hypothetical protein
LKLPEIAHVLQNLTYKKMAPRICPSGHPFVVSLIYALTFFRGFISANKARLLLTLTRKKWPPGEIPGGHKFVD